jgi:hypothetical protein
VRSFLAALATILSAVALFGAARAEAAPHMLVGIYDDGQTLFNTEQAFGGYRQLRAQVLRVMLRWSAVAPRRPQDGTDPADAAYDWALYDTIVNRASRAGIRVMFSIYGTPDWANGGRGTNHAPSNPADLRRFAFAAATRYSGTYTAYNAQVALPRVRLWLAWNEPNNPVFLQPQFRKAGKVTIYEAARNYADICEAVYAGVHGTMLAGEKVGCGVTAPRGNNAPNSSRPSTSPLAFLRALKRNGLEHFDAYSHHPYPGNRTETPRSKPKSINGRPPTAVTLGNIDSLISELTRLYGPKRLWITEYGFQTDPPDFFFGVSWARQAAYLTQAFAIARRNSRIDMMLWFLLRDEPAVSGWQSGFLTTTGVKKPAFTAYQRLPRA